jgi:hypothetical protein
MKYKRTIGLATAAVLIPLLSIVPHPANAEDAGSTACGGMMRSQGQNTRSIRNATIEAKQKGYTVRLTEFQDGKLNGSAFT